MQSYLHPTCPRTPLDVDLMQANGPLELSRLSLDELCVPGGQRGPRQVSATLVVHSLELPLVLDA